ncbi:MAG: protein kinase [Candidatus Pacebacteria bacterium]|nr:protein kinase [Candidatus Paceibacterota bacterium]
MVVDAVKYMQEFEPPIVHGHLTPLNIFIENGRALISDSGFESLTKYATLFAGYRSKSSYTAPELLVTKGNAVAGLSASCDIYSLGMILWYISLQIMLE